MSWLKRSYCRPPRHAMLLVKEVTPEQLRRALVRKRVFVAALAIVTAEGA